MFILRRPQRTDEGLGAASWLDRMAYVEWFRQVVVGWPSSPIALRKMTAADLSPCGTRCHSEEQKVVAVERIAYPFYCQTFFNYFGRAATVPYHFPV
jgi:hypothetical protein